MSSFTPKILIITNSKDEHAHLIVYQLNKLKTKVFRLDTDRLEKYFRISFYPNAKSPHFLCQTPVGRFDSQEISTLWIRRPNYADEGKDSVYKKLVRQEKYALFVGISEYFPKTTRIVDAPESVIRASNKVQQIVIARNLGFTFPESLITNDPTKAATFIKRLKGNVIIKPIDSGYAEAGNTGLSIHTTLVKPNADLSLVRNCPTYFQENIQKQYELRITVIGRKIFPVAFDVSGIPEAHIDSRMSVSQLDKVPHKLVKIPQSLEKKILSLLDYYGLHFSAIDMAKTPEGKYVFFELNPAGQFLWLDRFTPGLSLKSEMANYLSGVSEVQKHERKLL
ncbi:hypothetical protein HY468_02500 [Candidatus Roizmanbacteria bacterium]|nr:hypothetical protein [Candidatus Roizmanbacteria bacterium]